MTDAEKCRALAEKLGWTWTQGDSWAEWRRGGKPACEPAPTWTFAGAVLEELARRGLRPELALLGGGRVWDCDIYSADPGRTSQLVGYGSSEDGGPVLAVINAACAVWVWVPVDNNQ